MPVRARSTLPVFLVLFLIISQAAFERTEFRLVKQAQFVIQGEVGPAGCFHSSTQLQDAERQRPSRRISLIDSDECTFEVQTGYIPGIKPVADRRDFTWSPRLRSPRIDFPAKSDPVCADSEGDYNTPGWVDETDYDLFYADWGGTCGESLSGWLLFHADGAIEAMCYNDGEVSAKVGSQNIGLEGEFPGRLSMTRISLSRGVSCDERCDEIWDYLAPGFGWGDKFEWTGWNYEDGYYWWGGTWGSSSGVHWDSVHLTWLWVHEGAHGALNAGEPEAEEMSILCS